ncbi:MAG: TVP38/TMEM64 family protein, partial [Micromonosporaceae bacterium]
PAPGVLAAAVGSTGVPAPVVAVVAAAVLVVGLVPRTFLAAVAGLVFGPVTGAAYVVLGATAGALVAFGLGRWLGRDFVAVQRRLARLDGWLSNRGLLGVVTVRLLPIAPFGLTSYAFGTSGVALGAYLLGTVLGMLPTTVVYAYLGASSSRPGSAAFWVSAACAVGLWVGTLGLSMWLGRRRRPLLTGAVSAAEAGAQPGAPGGAKPGEVSRISGVASES